MWNTALNLKISLKECYYYNHHLQENFLCSLFIFIDNFKDCSLSFSNIEYLFNLSFHFENSMRKDDIIIVAIYGSGISYTISSSVICSPAHYLL